MSKHVTRQHLKRFGTGLVVIGSTFLLGACDSSSTNVPRSLSASTTNATTSASPATSSSTNPGTTSNAAPSTAPNTAPAATPVTGAANVVGSATVSWLPPQENADGSALTDLAGFRIHYGNSADDLSQVVNISTVGLTRFVIDNLAGGTWFFAVAAFNAAGVEGNLSNVASKTIG